LLYNIGNNLEQKFDVDTGHDPTVLQGGENTAPPA
jgi:hypothetical protein